MLMKHTGKISHRIMFSVIICINTHFNKWEIKFWKTRKSYRFSNGNHHINLS